jgi:RNA polymerase sigma-70 factor (ECF subfamily)
MNEAVQAIEIPPSTADFEGFFLEHRDALFGALWLVARNRHEAEELTQDAFLKVWERWDRVGALDDPVGYLFRTGMNLFRSRRRRALVALKRVAHLIPSDDGLREVETRDAVVRALGLLTPGQRTALVLTDLLQMTSEEAGRAMGIRASTVRVLSARARSALRERMGADDG